MQQMMWFTTMFIDIVKIVETAFLMDEPTLNISR